MKKFNVLRFVAAVCVLIGCLINLLNLFMEIPVFIYACTTPLLVVAVVLYGIVLVKQIKKLKGEKKSEPSDQES